MNRWIKAVVFAACLAPVAMLAWEFHKDALGPNPVERLTHQTGTWAIRFLMLTLAITPARKLMNAPSLIRYRRMMGLYAFFYASLHLMTYVWLDQSFDWRALWGDVYKRPFVTAGFAGWLVMVPLAVTSTAGWIRRIGGKRWQQLHRLVYFAGLAAVVHYWWLVKSDIREPLLYGAILLILMLYRAVLWWRPKPRLVVSRPR